MHFDQLTKRLLDGTDSRRGLLRLILGGGAAALLFTHGAEEAMACRRTRRPCAKNKPNGNCCSGTCKKGKCRPTPGAKGCTVNSKDACLDQYTFCPGNPNGVCVKLDNGKPLCHEFLDCGTCASHADCNFRPGGKCVKTCPICGPTSNEQGCVYPEV